MHTRGLFFDFIATQKAFHTLSNARVKEACHIIITPQLLATYDEGKKIHIRAAIFSFPTVISVSGIVEGPAKPREFYLYKQKYSQLGIWETEGERIKDKFKGRFIDYRDRRMNEVLKGYLAQGLFFYITGEPFCRKRGCRLFNAHWQEDLIFAQVKSAKFCQRHRGTLEGIKKGLDIG